LYACHTKRNKPGFSLHPSGYYYQLLSFESDKAENSQDKVLWLTASFKTQRDSVFWDSYNNLNDRFYIDGDMQSGTNFLKTFLSNSALYDSACLLLRTRDFFKQQFKADTIPFFCRQDSVVKINLKVKALYTKQEFAAIKHNLKKKEEEQIENYFGSVSKLESALDPSGFYWLERTLNYNGDSPKPGDLLTISYEGYYLNGRFLEKSGANFEFIYGTPDQLIKGLNYVIGSLKLGENAKIILPSRLAFGDSGSSNGTVPPYTPLVYKIQLIGLKSAETTSLNDF
jgi:FKBP-type peptidyl-prolyl cis-trans isomerase